VVRDTIARQFNIVYEEQRDETAPSLSLTDELVLLDSGVDSMGFAVLITRLEEELGYDPFSESDEPYYPRTFGEFVSFYEKHRR
jgi:acyl carrier protein